MNPSTRIFRNNKNNKKKKKEEEDSVQEREKEKRKVWRERKLVGYCQIRGSHVFKNINDCAID